MTRPTAKDLAQELANAPSLEDLYSQLEAIGVGPGWNKPTPSLWAAPRQTFLPVHWDYETAKGALDGAGRLINTELAERRNLILFNPAEGNTYGTVRTIVAAYQMIQDGEWARSHRHTPNALRLVIDCEPGVYTVVDGEKIDMMAGDVLLTPNWSTHGHGNASGRNAYWLDFLDAPLVQLLEPMFFEPHEKDESHEAFEDAPSVRDSSPFVFPIAQTRARLDAAPSTSDGPFGTQVELGNPALDTLSLFMMKLAPDVTTEAVRTTANAIFAVVEGEGTSVIDGESFAWKRGDVFAAPAWRPMQHTAASDTLLLRVTDAALLDKIGFLRIEAVR